MTQPSHSYWFWKALITCLILIIGAFIALFNPRQAPVPNGQIISSSEQIELEKSEKLQPSEEEFLKLNAEVDAFRATLSEEERKKFDAEVEELEKIIENMPPDGDKPLEEIGRYSWMYNPSVSLLSVREDKQAEGTFDAWYEELPENIREFFDQTIKEEEAEQVQKMTDDIIKMHQEIENSIANMTDQERKELSQNYNPTDDINYIPLFKLGKIKALLATMTKEERQDYYKKAQAELPKVIKENKIMQDAARVFRQELKKQLLTEEEMREWYQNNKVPEGEELLTWYRNIKRNNQPKVTKSNNKKVLL